MANKKTQMLERVSINLPVSIVKKVRKYAEEMGLNTTSAYIVLLSQALRQNDAFTQFPLLMAQMQQFGYFNTKNIDGKEE